MEILRRLARRILSKETMTNIAAGNAAPGFTLKSLDGKEYSLGKLLRRGPVVLAFFKVSCPVCQFTFPFIERLFQRYRSDDIAFLAVSQDDAAHTKDFAKQFGVTFPLLLDEEAYSVSNGYGLTMVPTFFLIETDGKVRVSCMGFGKRELEEIAKELAERRNIATAPLFAAVEKVPDHKPG
jgi:peroxiredoxin